MLITGLAGIILIEIYAAVMQRCFQHTDNSIGKGFAILGIYLFVICYCTSLDLSHWTTANLFSRRYAQQYYMAIRRRGTSHYSPQQSDGTRSRIALHC
jgi:hypothetical protein